MSDISPEALPTTCQSHQHEPTDQNVEQCPPSQTKNGNLVHRRNIDHPNLATTTSQSSTQTFQVSEKTSSENLSEKETLFGGVGEKPTSHDQALDLRTNLVSRSSFFEATSSVDIGSSDGVGGNADCEFGSTQTAPPPFSFGDFGSNTDTGTKTDIGTGEQVVKDLTVAFSQQALISDKKSDGNPCSDNTTAVVFQSTSCQGERHLQVSPTPVELEFTTVGLGSASMYKKVMEILAVTTPLLWCSSQPPVKVRDIYKSAPRRLN